MKSVFLFTIGLAFLISIGDSQNTGIDYTKYQNPAVFGYLQRPPQPPQYDNQYGSLFDYGNIVTPPGFRIVPLLVPINTQPQFNQQYGRREPYDSYNSGNLPYNSDQTGNPYNNQFPYIREGPVRRPYGTDIQKQLQPPYRDPVHPQEPPRVSIQTSPLPKPEFGTSDFIKTNTAFMNPRFDLPQTDNDKYKTSPLQVSKFKLGSMDAIKEAVNQNTTLPSDISSSKKHKFDVRFN